MKSVHRVISRATLIKTGKIALGSSAAMLLAQQFGVQYSASAGIITLLSIQDTKKATLQIAGKRIIAFAIALATSAAAFGLWGYHPLAFGLFLVLFVSLCVLAKLQEGISMCAVLMTHFMIEQSMSRYWIQNECMLMLIGTGIGVIMNLYMPSNKAQIRAKQNEIEAAMRAILQALAMILSGKPYDPTLSPALVVLRAHIEEALRQAYHDNDNSFSDDLHYFVKYMEMRKSQMLVLEHMIDDTQQVLASPPQAILIASLLKEVAGTLRESNNAVKLLEHLAQLKQQFREAALPETREEFEARAVLYVLLNNLQQFLEIKSLFAKKLSKLEKQQYWGDVAGIS